MPPLTHHNKLNGYRNGVAPVKKVHADEVWAKVLDQLGVELLSAPTSSTKAVKATTSMAASTEAHAVGAKIRATFQDLPVETQKEIFSYASTTDLITLSLVSKLFRSLAAERLYRSFHIVFPDEDDVSTQKPIDVLAAGLETIVASDYEYAKHLHEIVLEPVAAGKKGENSYRYYVYEQGYGKFINTLFLLVLRKARCLERFKWDIRVELSRPVFDALHKIEALQHLHIRLQSGHSTYQTPPPITTSSTIHVATHPVSLPLPPPPPGFGPPPHMHTSSNAHNIYTSSSSNSFGGAASKHGSKSTSKDGKLLIPALKKALPTLSGFKHLKTLEILDMDTLDYVSELRACIRNSSSTLHTLKLSFSEALANKSRKPPPEIHSEDDSEVEDEFGQVIPLGPPPPGMPSSTLDGPTKTLKAQEEKKKQEEVLHKILGLPCAKKQKPGKPDNGEEEKRKEKAAAELAKIKARSEDPRVRFIKNLGPVAKKLMKFVDPTADNSPDAKKVLELIERAAKLYTESVDGSQPGQAVDKEGSPEVSPTSSAEDDVVMSGGAPEEPGLFDAPAKMKKTVEADPGVANPEDIDIEEPEGEDLLDELDAAATAEDDESEAQSESIGIAQNEEASGVIKDPEVPNGGGPQPVTVARLPTHPQELAADITTRQHLYNQAAILRASHLQIQEEADILKIKMDELREKIQNSEPTDIDYVTLAQTEAEFKRVEARVDQLNREMEELGDEVIEAEYNHRTNNNNHISNTRGTATSDHLAPSKNSEMSEYLRTTRGLAIQELAIYLIPVKANTLSRGLDLTVLRSITLLNVGPQTSIWNTLAKENTVSPLPLAKIYTDNVTIPFLGLVAQLQNLSELLMTERQKPGRPEPTASKTTVKIDQIRKALKHRVANLKVLMIEHDLSSSWDIDIKTMMMLCQRADNLEELSVAFNAKVAHSFIQFMDEFSSLRALHVNFFRQDDQCVWVKANFVKFMADIVSHNPAMKLEYIAVDQSVERLVRRSKAKATKKTDRKGKSKSKGKAKVTDMKHLTEMVLGPSGSWPSGANGSSSPNNTPDFDWQASSDEEEPVPFVGKHGLKIETVEGVHFTDVTGVRIFEKDVISGRL